VRQRDTNDWIFSSFLFSLNKNYGSSPSIASKICFFQKYGQKFENEDPTIEKCKITFKRDLSRVVLQSKKKIHSTDGKFAAEPSLVSYFFIFLVFSSPFVHTFY
jgi:hypothetical protein